jgi:hypothetical protein
MGLDSNFSDHSAIKQPLPLESSHLQDLAKEKEGLSQIKQSTILRKTKGISFPILASTQKNILDDNHASIKQDRKISLMNEDDSKTDRVGTRSLGTSVQEEKPLEEDDIEMLMNLEGKFQEIANEKQENIAEEKEGLKEKAAFDKKIEEIVGAFSKGGLLISQLARDGTIKEVNHADVAKGNAKNLIFFNSEKGELMVPEHLRSALKLKLGDTYEGVKIKKITFLNDEEYKVYAKAYTNYARKMGLIPQQQSTTVALHDEQPLTVSTPYEHISTPRRRNNSTAANPQQQVAQERQAPSVASSTQVDPVVRRREARMKEFNKKVAEAKVKLEVYLDSEEKKADNLDRDRHTRNLNEENLVSDLLSLEQRTQAMKLIGFPGPIIKESFQEVHKEVRLILKDAEALHLSESDRSYIKTIDAIVTRIEMHSVNISGPNTSVGQTGISEQTPNR